MGYKSLAQIPTHRNRPVSSNVRPHKTEIARHASQKFPRPNSTNTNISSHMTQPKHFLKIPIILVPLLASCASGPTQDQLAKADFGREISTTECTAMAEGVISDGLKDPSSAQFRKSQCTKGSWASVPLLGMGVEFGWLQRGEVNGKNSYGGYVGFRPYQVLIRDGAVIRYCVSDGDGICVPKDK